MSLQSFETNVLTDIRNWAGKAETFLEFEAEDAWKIAKPILTAAAPEELGVLKAYILGALAKLPGVTDLAQVETALLDLLEAARAPQLAIAQQIGSKLLQALIAAVAAL